MIQISSLIFRRFVKAKSSNYINCRHMETLQPKIECLHSRGLIQISGKDSSEFLQGLITNDMKHFEDRNTSMYALFLNNKGRVLFDTIIYKIQENDLFYLECDFQIIDSLQKHLTMYILRKKINVKTLKDEIKVWTIFDPLITNKLSKQIDSKLKEQETSCSVQNKKSKKTVDNIFIYEDPRLTDLGLRILAKSNVNEKEILKSLGIKDSNQNDLANYKSHRLKLGIGEGIQDFPVGKALPLEINADYLHGISFHKGCYIGQELTARTHHTGIVRKRLMPLIIEQATDSNFEYDDKIYDENGNAVGKFRNQEKNFGLGLMRINESLKAKYLKIQEKSLKVIKPAWWMPESQKEAVSTTILINK